LAYRTITPLYCRRYRSTQKNQIKVVDLSKKLGYVRAGQRHWSLVVLSEARDKVVVEWN